MERDRFSTFRCPSENLFSNALTSKDTSPVSRGLSSVPEEKEIIHKKGEGRKQSI